MFMNILFVVNICTTITQSYTYFWFSKVPLDFLVIKFLSNMWNQPMPSKQSICSPEDLTSLSYRLAAILKEDQKHRNSLISYYLTSQSSWPTVTTTKWELMRVYGLLCLLTFNYAFLPSKLAEPFLPIRCNVLLILLSISGTIYQGLFPNLLPVTHDFFISSFFNWAKNSFWGWMIGASHTNEHSVVQRLQLHLGLGRKSFQESGIWSSYSFSSSF